MKRAYFATKAYDQEYGHAIIAHSLREAKKIAWKIIEDIDYTDLRVTWRKNATDIQDLPYGEVPLRAGLFHGLYGFIDEECEQCGEWTDYMSKQNIVGKTLICDDCLGYD